MNQNQTELKPMTIREAAKKLQGMGTHFSDDLRVELENSNDGWRLNCSIYSDGHRYTGTSFESCFEQIQIVAEAKKRSAPEQADRIIDL